MGVAAWRGGGEQERQKEAEEQTEQEQQEEPEEQMEQQQETETATSSTNRGSNIKRTPLSNAILSPKGPRAQPCLIVPPPHTHTHTGRKLLTGTLPHGLTNTIPRQCNRAMAFDGTDAVCAGLSWGTTMAHRS